jgi:hypothetical protein
MPDDVVAQIAVISCKELAFTCVKCMLTYEGLDVGTHFDRGDAIIRQANIYGPWIFAYSSDNTPAPKITVREEGNFVRAGVTLSCRIRRRAEKDRHSKCK